MARHRGQAHSGPWRLYHVFDGVYYWYGENKEKTDGKNGIWHWGVRCYASTDLYNWEDKGLIIPPEPDNPESPLYPGSCMDRPHIIYNQRTKKYVCWLKIMNRDGTQSETVLTADHILGPYEKVREGLRPLGMSAGDFDLAVAEDGKAYYKGKGHLIPELIGKYGIVPPAQDKERNTSIANYVWLPLRFDGEKVIIDWLDEWRIEDYE